MTKKILLFLFLFLVLFSSGCIRVLHHDEQKAAIEAEKFAEVAFVQQDFKQAYNTISDELKKYISLDEFTSTIEKMHPDGYPLNVSAVEYEPVPGQQAMNIFLCGQDEQGDYYYYRFVMQGTADKGYEVNGCFRGNGPYPNSSMRQPL